MANKQTPEQRLTKQIMLWCGERDYLCFHCNVGGGLMANGTYFRTGLPEGWPDLMILKNNGKISFCETKIHPRKPTQKQLDMIKELNNRGFNAFVAYNLDEFVSKFDPE